MTSTAISNFVTAIAAALSSDDQTPEVWDGLYQEAHSLGLDDEEFSAISYVAEMGQSYLPVAAVVPALLRSGREALLQGRPALPLYDGRLYQAAFLAVSLRDASVHPDGSLSLPLREANLDGSITRPDPSAWNGQYRPTPTVTHLGWVDAALCGHPEPRKLTGWETAAAYGTRLISRSLPNPWAEQLEDAASNVAAALQWDGTITWYRPAPKVGAKPRLVSGQKPGRFLQELASLLTLGPVPMEVTRAFSEWCREQTEAPVVRYAYSAEDICRVYGEVTGSCMDCLHDDQMGYPISPDGPTRDSSHYNPYNYAPAVYDTPDWAVAYVERKGRIVGRAVCLRSPTGHVTHHFPCYGDVRAMRRALQVAGVKPCGYADAEDLVANRRLRVLPHPAYNTPTLCHVPFLDFQGGVTLDKDDATIWRCIPAGQIDSQPEWRQLYYSGTSACVCLTDADVARVMDAYGYDNL